MDPNSGLAKAGTKEDWSSKSEAEVAEKLYSVINTLTRENAKPAKFEDFQEEDFHILPDMIETRFFRKGEHEKLSSVSSEQEAIHFTTPADFFNPKSGGKVRCVALVGGVGSGKTEIQKKIACDVLDHKIPDLKDVEVVHYFTLCDLRLDEDQTLGSFLFGHTELASDNQLLQRCMEWIQAHPEKFLLIIDELWRFQWLEVGGFWRQAVDIFTGIVSGDLLPGSKVLFSTFAKALREFEESVRPDRVISLVGFDQDTAEEVFSTLAGTQKHELLNRLRFSTPVHMACSIPGFLVHILSVLKKCLDGTIEHEPKTLTDILLLSVHNFKQTNPSKFHEIIEMLWGDPCDMKWAKNLDPCIRETMAALYHPLQKFSLMVPLKCGIFLNKSSIRLAMKLDIPRNFWTRGIRQWMLRDMLIKEAMHRLQHPTTLDASRNFLHSLHECDSYATKHIIRSLPDVETMHMQHSSLTRYDIHVISATICHFTNVGNLDVPHLNTYHLRMLVDSLADKKYRGKVNGQTLQHLQKQVLQAEELKQHSIAAREMKKLTKKAQLHLETPSEDLPGASGGFKGTGAESAARSSTESERVGKLATELSDISLRVGDLEEYSEPTPTATKDLELAWPENLPVGMLSDVPLLIEETFQVGSKGRICQLGGCKMTIEEGTLMEKRDIQLSLDYDMSQWVDGYTGIFPIISVKPDDLVLSKAVKFEIITWVDLAEAPEVAIDLFWRKNNKSNWSKIEQLSWAGRKVTFKAKHFSDYLLSLKKFLDWLLWSKLWIANFLYHDSHGNFTTLFCLDDKPLIKECIDDFKEGGCTMVFPRAKVKSFPRNREVHCQIKTDAPEAFGIDPADGCVFTFNLSFQDDYDNIVLVTKHSAPPDTFLLRYCVTVDGKDIINMSCNMACPFPEEEEDGRYDIRMQHSPEDFYERHKGDEAYYQITASDWVSKGKALIINNQFNQKSSSNQGHARRTGSRCDFGVMCSLFKRPNICCFVTPGENLPEGAFKKKIKEFRDGLITGSSVNVSFFAVVLMSHGGEDGGTDVIYCEDNKSVSLDWIFECFDCDKLAPVPKMFILQCCRGSKKEKKGGAVEQTADRNRIPPNSVVLYPSRPSFKSYRCPQIGTRLIREVKKVFETKCHNTDVLTMMKEVESNVAAEEHHKGKQTPEVKDSLTKGKNFFLFPGWPKKEN